MEWGDRESVLWCVREGMEEGVGESEGCVWCVGGVDGWVGGWIAEMEDGWDAVGCDGVWWRVEELGVSGVWGVCGAWRVIGGRGWGVGKLGSWGVG